MTNEQVQALSDAELVRLVAEHLPELGIFYHNGFRCFTDEFGKRVVWRPLESWDHAHMVIDSMQAKGFGWELSTIGSTGNGEPSPLVLDAKEQR